MDSVSPGFAELNSAATISSSRDAQDPQAHLQELCGHSVDEFWQAAEAGAVGLAKEELARVLLALGSKYNYGVAPGVSATRAQIVAFWRSLQLRDLALAHACALGRDAAWQQFMATYKEPLTQAAIGITRSATMGQELADSFYSAMVGLNGRVGVRWSPLAYYSGRGSFKGFLRAALAQRHVDSLRRTYREAPLPADDLTAAPAESIPPAPAVLSQLGDSSENYFEGGSIRKKTVCALGYGIWIGARCSVPRETLRVHEATVSRRIGRLTARLHQELLAALQASGMSRAAAEEALGTDPRDININLRSVLQISQSAAFNRTEVSAEPERI